MTNECNNRETVSFESKISTLNNQFRKNHIKDHPREACVRPQPVASWRDFSNLIIWQKSEYGCLWLKPLSNEADFWYGCLHLPFSHDHTDSGVTDNGCSITITSQKRWMLHWRKTEYWYLWLYSFSEKRLSSTPQHCAQPRMDAAPAKIRERMPATITLCNA